MDSLIDATIETLLCREVYAAQIRAAMPHGQMQHVARRAGISRQFLHRILVVDDGDGPCAAQAWPSVETASRVAGALDIEEKEAAKTLGWMLKALSARKPGSKASSQRGIGQNIDAVAEQIRELTTVATGTPCPKEGVAACRSVVERGTALIEQADSRNHARAVVEVSLCVHAALEKLGEHAQALYYARRAEYILELADGARWRSGGHNLLALRVAVSRAVAAAYAALGLVKPAMRALAIARMWARKGALLESWLPRLNSTEIRTWMNLRRFTLRRLRGLLEEATSRIRDLRGGDVIDLRLRAAEGYLAHAGVQGAQRGVRAAGRELEKLHEARCTLLGWSEARTLEVLDGLWDRLIKVSGSAARDSTQRERHLG